MKKNLAATLLAAVTAATPAGAATPAYNIMCLEPGTDGVQKLEAYEAAPGIMEVWYNLHAHIKLFEPLTRGAPIGPDEVIHARIRPLRMDLRYHTVNNIGYAIMTSTDFARVFNIAPARPPVTVNGYVCRAAIMHGKARLLPFDPHRQLP